MMPTTETKTKTKLRKGAKAMSYTEDQVKEMLENARKEEAEKTRAEIEAAEPSYFSDEPDDNHSLFSNDNAFKAPVMDIESEDMDDIFTYCDKHYHSKGKLVSYVIKKDGHFVGEQYHPFSWSKTQEKFGGGNFTIMAKDANNKTYIKQQTQLVQEPLKTENDHERERVVIQQAPAPQAPQFDPNLLLDFVAKMQLTQKSDEKAVAREEAKSNTTIITAMMEAQQKAQQQQMDMMFKMQDQTSKMIQAMSDNTTKLVENMRREFMEVVKAKPKEEFGFKELMLLQSNSRNEGFEQMKMIMEIAESKAEEKAEILAGQDNDTGTIGKLIGAVVPLITATTKQMTPPPQPQRRMVQQPRRPLPPPQSITRAAPAGTFAPQAQPPQAETRRAEIETNNGASEGGDDTFSIFAPVGVEVEREEVMAQGPDGEKSLDQLFSEANPVQQRVAQEIIPIIAESMTSEPKMAAQKANIILGSIGAELQMLKADLLKEFTFDLVWNIAKAFGIRDDKSQQWFKEFYAAIEATENSTNGPS